MQVKIIRTDVLPKLQEKIISAALIEAAIGATSKYDGPEQTVYMDYSTVSDFIAEDVIAFLQEMFRPEILEPILIPYKKGWKTFSEEKPALSGDAVYEVLINQYTDRPLICSWSVLQFFECKNQRFPRLRQIVEEVIFWRLKDAT